MARLSQPKNVDKNQREILQELMHIHGSRRIEVRERDGLITKRIYEAGVPVKEIAAAYGVAEKTVYDIIARANTAERKA